MQKGINSFSFLTTDISGSPVTGIDVSAGFTIFGVLATQDVSLYDWSIVENEEGFYTITIDLDNIGQGYFGIETVTPSLFVTPDFWDVSLENNDADSLYTLFVSLQQAPNVASVDNFIEVNTNPFKEADDITLSYVIDTSITPNLTGWTNLKAELRTSLSLTSSTSASYLGLADITVVDPLTNTITLDISGALTEGTVPEGSNTTNLYMDLQGINPVGKKKTLIDFTIPIIREITQN